MKELEALRTDVANAAKKVLPSAAAPPKPKIVPPLEDYHDHPRSAPVVPPTNGFHSTPPNAPTSPPASFSAGANVPAYANFKPPLSADPLSASHVVSPNSPSTSQQSPHAQLPSPQPSVDPLGTPISLPNPAVPPQQQPLPPPSTSTAPAPLRAHPLPPSTNRTTSQSPAPPAQPLTAGSSIPRSPLHEPPLGGRFTDGTKSMFITPSAAPLVRTPLAANSPTPTSNLSGGSQPFDPLRSDLAPRPATPSPLQPDPVIGAAAGHQQISGLDPLAQVRPHQMSQSMRVQPTRPRLDAREAASKLANMF